MTTDHTKSLMPAWVPRVNRLIVNRVQRLWAPWLPPWALLRHVGRRSGRAYAIPVLAFRRGREVSFMLVYGSRAQWVRNVEAAGGCGLRRMGADLELRNPRVVGPEYAGELPWPTALAARRMGILVCDVA